MNKLANISVKPTCLRNPLILAVIPILVLVNILVTTVKSEAAPMRRPTAASIDSVNGSMKYRSPGRGDSSVDSSNKRNFRLYGGAGRQLVISNGSAGLGFLDTSGRIGSANLYYALSRSSRQPTRYYYPCEGQGSFTIGWKPGDQQARGGGCDGVVLQGLGGIHSSNFGDNGVASLPNSLSKNQLGSKSLLKAEVPGKVMRYCSAVADSNHGWSAVVSNSPWDILSSNDPCEQAIRQCELNSGDSCSVTNMGEKNGIEPDENVTVALQCDNNQVISESNDFTALNESLLSKAQSNELKQSACTLHILNANDRLVFPTTDQPTVITTDIGANGKPQITVLAGEVQVVSANPQLQPSILNAGKVCNSLDLISRPDSTQTPQQACQISDIPQAARQAIRNSDAVKNFLSVRQSQADTGTWSSELKPDIQQYEQAVNQQFFDPSQPSLR